MMQRLTKEELAAVGAALFGSRWKSELAQALGRHHDTVKGWASGKRSIPETVTKELHTLVNSRILDLRSLAVKIAPAE